jgi:hypothetical protein
MAIEEFVTKLDCFNYKVEWFLFLWRVRLEMMARKFLQSTRNIDCIIVTDVRYAGFPTKFPG